MKHPIATAVSTQAEIEAEREEGEQRRSVGIPLPTAVFKFHAEKRTRERGGEEERREEEQSSQQRRGAAAGDGFRNPTDSFQIPTLPFKNTQERRRERERERARRSLSPRAKAPCGKHGKSFSHLVSCSRRGGWRKIHES